MQFGSAGPGVSISLSACFLGKKTQMPVPKTHRGLICILLAMVASQDNIDLVSKQTSSLLEERGACLMQSDQHGRHT